MNVENNERNNERVGIILGVFIIVIVIIATTAGCGFYNVLNADDFQKEWGAIGYTVTSDVESEYKDYKITKYMEASKDDVPFTISFYELDDEKEAQKLYKTYKDNLANYLTTSSKNKETTGAVFAKTVAVSDNEYIVISRVKNTIIFIPGLKDFKTTINDMLDHVQY